jgi:hypothetical protein
MKKIRLGNDIQIIWSVRGAQWLDVEELDVSLLNKLDEEVQFIPSIEVDETTNVCTISGTFAGRNQKLTGTYRLLLQMNKGKADMLTLDHIEVFQLVDVCSFGIVEGLDSDNLTTATVEVSDIVSTIVGNTDLSSYITRAEFESALTTKQDELHYLTEDTDEGSASLSSGGARIDVISTDEGGTTNIEGANVEIHDLSENNGIAVSGDGVAVTTGEGNEFTYNGVKVATIEDLSSMEVWNVGTLTSPSFVGHTWADLQALVMGESTTLLLRGEESHGYDLYFSIAGIVYQGETLLETTFIGQKSDKSQLILTLTDTNGSISCTPTNVINVNNSNFSTFGYTKAQIDTLLLAKMDDIDIDPSPSSGSLHLVTSGGIYMALQGKQATLVVGTNLDNTPVSASNNPITSGGVYSAIQGLGNMTISEQSGTTLTAALNTYYVYSSAVSTLAITLPSISSATAVSGFVVNLTTGDSISLTLTAAGGETIKMYSGLSIAASKEYELNFIWNGSEWIVAYGEVVSWGS